MGTAARAFAPDNVAAAEQPRPLDPTEVGFFVRIRREVNGWSQETLADISDLSVRTVQRVEDEQPSSVDTRRALARAFEVEDIDFFSKPMPAPDEVQVCKLMEECRRLQAEKEQVEAHMTRLHQRSENAQMMLNMAAARDLRWLNMVRTTLMPRQASRVPFHNAAEIAMRGYHCSMRGKPTLRRVTWSQLPYDEGGLHRGYHAGLIFQGSDFAPGVTCAWRREGAVDAQLWWRQPNIYFGERLETSTHHDPDESPVSWRGMEFAVRNPDGELSNWVEFSYQFDDERLLALLRASEAEGRRLFGAGQAAAADEPLRRAWVFSLGLFGERSEEHQRIVEIRSEAADVAAWARLRFREGARLRVASGEHAGATGTVTKLYLHCVQAYWMTLDAGGEVSVADKDVEGFQ